MKTCKVILAIASLFFYAQVQTQTLYNNVGHIPAAYQEIWNVACLLQDFSSTTADSVFMITGSICL